METMDSSNVHALLIPDEDESSVDIYAGLDALSGTPEKSSARASPRLKDSMDLYEEMVREEQQSRESSYNELKSRYQAAQIQIQELHRRLELMETQNTGLNTENFRLKKNISALLRTARQEVTRKDEEIQRLNQRSGKGRLHFNLHVNGLWDPKSSTCSSISKPPPTLPPSPARVDRPPRKPPQPYREERPGGIDQPSGSAIETRTPNPSSSSSNHPKCSSQGDVKVSDTEKSDNSASSNSSSKHREERHQTQKLSERKHKVDLPPTKTPQPSREERSEVTAQPSSSSTETRTLNPSSSSSNHRKCSSQGHVKVSDTENSDTASSNTSSQHGEASKHREERHQTQKLSDPERKHKVDLPSKKPPQPSIEERGEVTAQPSSSFTETITLNPFSSSSNHLKCSSQGDVKVSDTENSDTASSNTSSQHGEVSKHREERHQTQKLSDTERKHKVDLPSRKPPQPSREERGEVTGQTSSSSTEARTLNPFSSSHGDCRMSDTEKYANINSSSRHGETDKHKESKHREERHQSQKLSDPLERRHRSDSNSNKDLYVSEKNRSHKADKDTRRRYNSRSGKSRHHPNEEPHQRSERPKSPTENKGRSRERRQDKSGLCSSDRPERRTSARGSKEGHCRDDKKPRTEDKHIRLKRSGSREQKQTSSEEHGGLSSKGKGMEKKSEEKRKEERRREEDPGRRDKRSRGSEKQRSKESDQGEITVASERSSGSTEKTSVEENSPNRKLCFMETLNLTLSPVKKALLPDDVTQEDLTPVTGSEDDGSLPDAEDMCIIDEVDSSELQDGCDEDVDANVAKPSVDVPSDETDERPESEKVEDNKIQSETAAAEEQLEDHCVQTTSELHQPAVNPTPRSPEDKDGKRIVDETKSTLDGETLESGKSEATTNVMDTQRSIVKPETKTSSPKADCATEGPNYLAEHGELDSMDQSGAQRSTEGVAEDAAALDSKEPPAPQHVDAKAAAGSDRLSPSVLPQGRRQEPCPSDRPASKHQRDCKQDGLKDADAVSSTISPEAFPHERLSLREAIYVLTQTNEEVSDRTAKPSSSVSYSDVSKVSSTTEETKLSDEYAVLTITPKKMFSPGKRQTGREERHIEPSSSVLLLHDEDSMMRTLSSLKSIPDAISPLRSPARITKRNLQHCHGKPGHVKSLRKDFSGTSVEADSVKLDVNKENKYPGSPAKLLDKVSELLPSLSDNDLEEGEIISESDEAAAASPLPSSKRAKLARPVRNPPSPKATLQFPKKKPESELNEAAGTSSQSPSNKSRFKTVCPAACKASYSTIEEVMEMFKMVRAEIRKKYMKLHKTFPRKSFYGMMDNFQKSFVEFVDGAQFGQLCSQAGDLKARLKKLVASVFNKVSNNGIVKRIFEQQAIDLKQKLWDFVDVQVDYLFMDILKTLKELCRPEVTQADNKRPTESQKLPRKQSVLSLNRVKSPSASSHQTGLGIRGKDIRMSHVGRDGDAEPPLTFPNRPSVLPPKNIPPTPEKSNTACLVVSQSSSLLDKSDFEILTEQQTSSLTFNLVRDSQMGEIFKCLLQGSDLLESSVMAGETSSWSLSTPRKDGESLISIATPTKFDSPSKLLSPTKFQTPSKLLTTWSSISPCKMSPRSKDQVPLNPALFDESCLLEVPLESRVMLQATQRTYSILAEDLAVSLTIPSPLKSDSHLSFLQPPAMSIVSTPDSVISAHISEDALLDGEDATEQDIHLALDTDHSSCGSSSSVTSEAAVTPFHFKPDFPMQAVVMERSNDHFIVKIRHAATADTTLIADESLSQTLTDDQHQREENISALQSPSKAISSGKTPKRSSPSMTMPPDRTSDQPVGRSDVCLNRTLEEERQRQGKQDASTRQRTTKSVLSKESQRGSSPSKPASSDNSSHNTMSEAVIDTDAAQDRQHKRTTSTPDCVWSQQIISPSSHQLHNLAESSTTKQRSLHVSDSRVETEASESERSLNIAEDQSSSPGKDQGDRKRKKHQDHSKAKRRRKVEEERKNSNPKKKKAQTKSSLSESPNSLHAKNVVRKKGEVVMAWTRDEDRSILLELKTKGASRETFSALSEKLEKPSAQIAERFYQLMKLFKKQEKMET